MTASGKVLWHFAMSLDGDVAGPNHELDRPAATPFRLRRRAGPDPAAVNVRYRPVG